MCLYLLQQIERPICVTLNKMRTLNFLQSWSDQELKRVEKIVKNYLNKSSFSTSHGFKLDLYSEAGLAYTSRSAYAGLWVCNISIFIDVTEKYAIQGFAMTTGGFVYAICWDENENEIIVSIN